MPPKPAILYRDRQTTKPSTTQPYYLPPAISPNPYLSLPSHTEENTPAQNIWWDRQFTNNLPSLNTKISRLAQIRALERERLYGPDVVQRYEEGETPDGVKRRCWEGHLSKALTAFKAKEYHDSKRSCLLLLRQTEISDDLLLEAFQLCTCVAEKVKLMPEERAVYAKAMGNLEREGLLDASIQDLQEDAANLSLREDEATDSAVESARSSCSSDWVFE